MTSADYKSLFFPYTLGRLAYLARFVFIVLLYAVVGQLIIYAFSNTTISAYLLLAWIILVVGYHFTFVVIPRIRDFGLPAIAVLLCFIPLLNMLVALALFFGPHNYWQKLRNQKSQSETKNA